jgi:hypothetical protein
VSILRSKRRQKPDILSFDDPNRTTIIDEDILESAVNIAIQYIPDKKSPRRKPKIQNNSSEQVSFVPHPPRIIILT